MKKILSIDDSETNNLLVKLLLEENKAYNVLSIIKPKVAIKYIKKVKPDLILLDIMMPSIDGLELLNQIKADPGIQHIDVAIVSANLTKSTITKAKDLGAVLFINKPLGLNNLAEKINNHFNNK